MVKKKQPPPTAALNVRNIPRSLRDIFRVWCGNRGYTVQDAITALMREAMARDAPLQITPKPEE